MSVYVGVDQDCWQVKGTWNGQEYVDEWPTEESAEAEADRWRAEGYKNVRVKKISSQKVFGFG